LRARAAGEELGATARRGARRTPASAMRHRRHQARPPDASATSRWVLPRSPLSFLASAISPRSLDKEGSMDGSPSTDTGRRASLSLDHTCNVTSSTTERRDARDRRLALSSSLWRAATRRSGGDEGGGRSKDDEIAPSPTRRQLDHKGVDDPARAWDKTYIF
jgi:hypothetical protein